MLEDAVRALSQMTTPPFRSVLLRSVGLAVVLLILIGIGLQRLLSAGLQSGAGWIERTFAGAPHGVISVIEIVLALTATIGLFVGLIFLMPAVSALVASFFADEIAEQVERRHYPAEAPGKALPLGRALFEGVKTAALAVLVYLCAVPFLLVAGLGALVFFFAAAFLLGREYFLLAAMRFR